MHLHFLNVFSLREVIVSVLGNDLWNGLDYSWRPLLLP